MPQTNTKSRKQTRFKLKEPAMYNCIMHNDDITTMDFVVTILIHVFHKAKNTAEKLMMQIHTEGSTIVGTYSKDIAESKSAYTMGLAKANGFPLKVTTSQAN